ncbi:MAG TPA: ISAzo13 family transposase [Methanophagales archaeon]|nr:ISAzo13 family transposase [Methanophagales archaeon]
MDDIEKHKNWLKVLALADEALKRKLAAAKALDLGWGGISTVTRITGMSPTTIRKGIQELDNLENLEQPKRIRKPGGGRKRTDIKSPKIVEDLEAIMGENTAGDPMSFLKWTCKSTYKIADELNLRGHKISAETVRQLLRERAYSLQANVKTKEGGSEPERDAQFRYINEQVKKFVVQGDPVISVDTKKREIVGDFKNPGRTWRKKRDAKEVNVYDFPSLGIGVAIPYGAYDIKRGEGFVNVDISRDTSEFAVESIRQWWKVSGKKHYPNARELLICADGGGSNGSRRRGWKFFLQELTDQIGIPISLCHFPPGTCKWNKIEHCMFSFISMNWKGEPLVTYETIIKLISATTTKKGLKVVARLDKREYEGGVKFSDEDMAKLNIKTHMLHPKWNYSIVPRKDTEPDGD